MVARLVDVTDGLAVVEAKTAVRAVADTASLWLLASVLKGPRYETALRMAVELGATEVVPVLAKRCVAKGERRERWLRVLSGAAQQSGRTVVPTLHPLGSLSEALARVPEEALRWVCVPGAAPVAGTAAAGAVLVGPEGGLTDAEVAAAEARGWCRAGLGTHTLRAETATAAALVRIRCGGAPPDA